MRHIINKTDAIVLRIFPYSNTSHIVRWLTADFGKLTTIVKGACRPKSRFLGQYDLFYTCDLLFYSRDHGGLHIIKEASPQKTRKSFRSDWKASFIASYVCDLASRVTASGHHQPELYTLIDRTLDFLCTETADTAFLFWLELKLMQTLGFAPQLQYCFACHTNLSAIGSDQSHFSYAGGGILCSACAQRQRYDSRQISSDVLNILRNLQNTDLPPKSANLQFDSSRSAELSELLGLLLQYHLDYKPISRNILMELIAGN